MPPSESTAVLLIGHGRKAKDTPAELVDAYRQAKEVRTHDPMEFNRAEQRLRDWPRNSENDPYQSGLQSIAAALRAEMGVQVVTAFNEFCGPSIEDAIESLVADGIKNVVAMTTMITPGGNHSENDIPQTLNRLETRHAGLSIRYVWPFPMAAIARFLAESADLSNPSRSGHD